VFARPKELRHAEWSELDLDAAVWSIPAVKMKMRRPHRVPLSLQSLAIIRDLDLLQAPADRPDFKPTHARHLPLAISRCINPSLFEGQDEKELTFHRCDVCRRGCC
jgi:integrase